MRFMPLFLDLTSGTVALNGSGAAAAGKLRLLRSAGANVRWYAGNDDETALALAQDISTFIFPAVVDRGEVIVAIGTGGASPVLARRLRERIEAVLPSRIGDLAALMGRSRGEFARLRHASCSPRRFWESVVDGPIAT